MLFPEYTSSRIPSDVALKTGLVNKQGALTITTNASGSAAIVFTPQNFDSATTANPFYRIFNDSTFSPTTGIQVPSGSAILGPVSGLSTTIQTCRLTAFSIIVQPIVSTLNNSGRVIYIMNDFSTASLTADKTPFNTTTCRDAQYCIYGSMSGASGHRLMYDNASVADESFSTYTAVRDQDVLQIIFEGCAANTAVA